MYGLVLLLALPTFHGRPRLVSYLSCQVSRHDAHLVDELPAGGAADSVGVGRFERQASSSRTEHSGQRTHC
jgi:hypothetical protein